jgi:tetratricopeptide (TPR) repeat protein
VKVVEVAPEVVALLESGRKELETFGMGALNPYCALVSTLGYALASLGDLKEGRAQCEKALHLATQIDHLGSMAYAECMYAGVLMIQGDGHNTVEHGRNAMRYSEEAQNQVLVVLACNFLAWGYRFLGDIKSGVDCLKKGIGIRQATGFSGVLLAMYSNLGQLYLESGDTDNARSCAEKALELVPQASGRFFEGFARAYSGSVLGKVDNARFAEAEESVLQGIRILDEVKTRAFCAYGYIYLGELYADVGQKEKALASLKKAQEMCQEMGMDYYLARAEKALATLQR